MTIEYRDVVRLVICLRYDLHAIEFTDKDRESCL